MNNQTVEELNKRNLDECYFCIYSIPVNIYFNNGDSFINPKTLLLFFGCNLQGKRRFITSIISDDLNKASDWYDFFLSFKNRNLKYVLYGLFPNNIHLKKAVKIAFPEIHIFDSYCESLIKISKYLPVKHSSNTTEFIRKIFVSKSLDDYIVYYNEFKDKFSNSPFLIDLLDDDFIKAKNNYSYDFELRKHVFAFYFIRELSKKLIVISHSKSYFSSCNDFINEVIPIIQVIERKTYCSKKDWINLINLIYSSRKDLIKCYL